MSQIQDESIANEKNKNPFKQIDVEVPLRDRIDNDLLNKLVKDNFGHKISKMWQTANADRVNYLNKQQAYLADWDRFFVENTDGPFAGTSNIHLPVTFIVLKTYHARFLQILENDIPMPKARRPDSLAQELAVGETMKYTLKDWCNHYEGISATFDAWIWDWCGHGASTIKRRWDIQYERFMDVAQVPEQVTRFEVGQDGEEIGIPELRMKEIEQEREIKVFEGPVYDKVQNEDLIIIGGDGNPQKADVVLQQEWLSASELNSLVAQGVFKKEAVKNVINAGDDPRGSSTGDTVKQEKIFRAGQGSLDVDFDLDRYKIIEAYLKHDVNKTGINSEIIVWIHPKTGEILRATYLRRVQKAGNRPFFRIEFHRRDGTNHPIGLIEILYPLAKEMDAIHNMRIDAGIISTMPFGFYRANSSLEPETIRYEPGSLIPVDNPQTDVFFPNLGNRATFGVQEEAALQVVVERVTGVSDFSLGAISGKQGAARTATGVRGLVGEQNANLDVHLRRLMRGYKYLLKDLLHTLQQRIPPGLSFRVTGKDGEDYWAEIRDKEDIAGDFDFEIDPASADSNPQVREARANEVLQIVMNPLLIQTGNVSVGNIYEATKNFLQARGIKDWSRFITKPPQHRVIMTPEEEANRVLRGMSVPVTPESDHEGFIEYYNFLIRSPELLAQMDEQGTVALTKQMQEHQKMQQALQAAAAQQANLNQMQQNASLSQFQAPEAANPVAGPGPQNGA